MISESKDLVVAVFAYNRPSHLRRVLISLENYKIPLAYVFLDGPKNRKDKILQKEIIFISKFNPYIKLHLKKNKINKGLANSIVSGVSFLSKKYKNIIILEDDCVPRKEFFIFVKKILKNEQYKKDPTPICGYQFPELEKKNKKILPFYFNYFIPWGWCVNSNYWQKYLKFKKNKKISFSDKLINKISQLTKNKNKKIWSRKFIEFNLMMNKKIIFPNISLIKNIGFDGSGVNSSLTNKFNTFYSKAKIENFNFNIKNDKLLKNKQMKILLKRVKYFF